MKEMVIKSPCVECLDNPFRGWGWYEGLFQFQSDWACSEKLVSMMCQLLSILTITPQAEPSSSLPVSYCNRHPINTAI
jgi:hypothetical protein